MFSAREEGLGGKFLSRIQKELSKWIYSFLPFLLEK